MFEISRNEPRLISFHPAFILSPVLVRFTQLEVSIKTSNKIKMYTVQAGSISVVALQQVQMLLKNSLCVVTYLCISTELKGPRLDLKSKIARFSKMQCSVNVLYLFIFLIPPLILLCFLFFFFVNVRGKAHAIGLPRYPL